MPKSSVRSSPICEFCNKPINGTPCLKLSNAPSGLEDKEVMLHGTGCPVRYIASYMKEKGYVKAGDHWKMIKFSKIHMEVVLTKNFKGGLSRMYWAPEWAVNFVKASRRFDNEARHTALHICAKLNSEEKQHQFSGMVRLGGLPALYNILLMQNPEDICCERGEKFIKKLKKRQNDS